MLKAYAVGFFGAVLVLLVAVAIWLAVRPAEEPGLLWGGTVYTSKQEFKGYLKSRGLSYKVWLARNPGTAPWEPAVARAASARTTTEAVQREEPSASAPEEGDEASWLPLAAIAVLLAAGSTLLASRAELRPVGPRIRGRRLPRPRPRPRQPRQVAAAAGASPHLGAGVRGVRRGGARARQGVQAAVPALGPGVRALGRATARAAASLRAALPLYGRRLLADLRADWRVAGGFVRARNIGAGDVAFGLLAVTTAAMFVLFVVVLLTA